MRAEAGLRAETQAGTRDVDRGNILDVRAYAVGICQSDSASPSDRLNTRATYAVSLEFEDVSQKQFSETFFSAFRERTGHGNPAARSSVSGGSSVSSATSRRSARPGKWCWSTCLRARKSRAKGGEGVRREREVFRGRGKPRRTGRTRLYAVRIALDLEDDLVPRVLQAEVKAADPGEQRDRLHRGASARYGVTKGRSVRKEEVCASRKISDVMSHSRKFPTDYEPSIRRWTKERRFRGLPTRSDYGLRRIAAVTNTRNEHACLTTAFSPRAPKGCWWVPSR